MTVWWGGVASSNLARVYLRGNNTEEALKYLKKVPVLENSKGELSYRALYDSAKIYGKLGELRAACEPLQQLYDLNPAYRDVNVLLHNYREMVSNHNLYLLYYGDQNERSRTVRHLLQQLMPGVRRIEAETYNRTP